MIRSCTVMLSSGLLVFGISSAIGQTIEVARGTAVDKPIQPQIAIDSKGVIHVVFGRQGHVCYSCSNDGGETFTAAKEISGGMAIAIGMRRGPRLCATDRGVCVTYVGGKQGKGRDGDLLAQTSLDGGKTWNAAVMVNDAKDSAREGLHGMAAGQDGKICCVWLDLRNQRTEVMSAMSEDNGRTWKSNSLVYQSPTGSVCECCHPSVCFSANGTIHVLWRNSLSGDRDMYCARSEDGGETFSDAIKLGSGTWTLDACPMDGGGIAAGNNNLVYSVWRRENTVFLCKPGGVEEQPVGEGEQPGIACADLGPFVIWLQHRGGTAILRRPDVSKVEQLTAHANDPVIAASSDGELIGVAWENVDHDTHTILCKLIHTEK